MVLSETLTSVSSIVNNVTSPALNYFRLAKITLVEGTEQVGRKAVMDNLPNGETIHSLIIKNKKKLAELRERRIITDKQWRILYPEGRNVDPVQIDLTLWIILLRNISRCKFRNVDWNEAPSPDQTEWYHDVLRIKETRNTLSHLLKPELDDESFERMWNNVTSALRRLNM
jgi:hypothetical protein